MKAIVRVIQIRCTAKTDGFVVVFNTGDSCAMKYHQADSCQISERYYLRNPLQNEIRARYLALSKQKVPGVVRGELRRRAVHRVVGDRRHYAEEAVVADLRAGLVRARRTSCWTWR